MSLLDNIGALGRPVAYHPGLARMLGSVKAGILLDQLLYWWPRRTSEGVYKSVADLTEETGLSKKEQMSARKVLKDRGIITEHYDRLNHRMYFYLDEDALEQAWEAFTVTSRSAERELREVPKGSVAKDQKGTSSITEITTETTTESTHPPKRKKIKHPTLHVPMSETRYDNLCSQYGREKVDEAIESYMDWEAARSRSPSKDYAASAANWLRKEREFKQQNGKGSHRKQSVDDYFAEEERRHAQ